MKNWGLFELLIVIFVGIILVSCQRNSNYQQVNEKKMMDTIPEIHVKPTDIIDSELTFEEAIAGSDAPQHILDELVLLDVRYFSTDDKIHRGQILVNKKIEKNVEHIFEFMFEHEFAVYQVVPMVKFDWDDMKSMEANNSSGFCYRDVMNTKRKSKHSTGMAIDINPLFNPIRWKSPNKHRPNIPEGAVLDTTNNGTLYPDHPVVEEMKRLGFKWGNQFRRYWDDHHFEK